MADPDLSSRLLFVHRSLLSGEVTAPRVLFSLCLEPLVKTLRLKAPKTAREEMWQDAAIDAILELIARPHRYDPRKSAVLTYLSVIAQRRLIDALRRETRQTQVTSLETDLASQSFVAGEDESANTLLERLDQRGDFSQWQLGEAQVLLESSEERARLDGILREILPDARDRRAFELIAQGRVATEELAAALELEELPVAEQRKEVKRHRDRIMKRIQRQQSRWGACNDET